VRHNSGFTKRGIPLTAEPFSYDVEED
jgi:hypothetical protein